MPAQLFAPPTRCPPQTQPEDLRVVDELDVRGKKSKVRLWTLAEPRLAISAAVGARLSSTDDFRRRPSSL